MVKQVIFYNCQPKIREETVRIDNDWIYKRNDGFK